MKQNITALEWLIKEFSVILGPLETEVVTDLLLIDAIKQAKQMEREQIQKAVEYGCSDWGSGKDAEQYYNETYGKE